MTAEREALRMGIEHLTVLFPKEVSSFDFQVESSGRTVQYKLNAQSLRLFGLHSDVNDAHCAGANRLQNKQLQRILQDRTAGPTFPLLLVWQACTRSSLPILEPVCCLFVHAVYVAASFRRCRCHTGSSDKQ